MSITHDFKALEDENARLRAVVKKTQDDIINIRETNERIKSQYRSIQRYDTEVRAMIESDQRLSDAWDNFRVMYQLVADEELIRTAREKINNANTDARRCRKCKQVIDGVEIEKREFWGTYDQ